LKVNNIRTKEELIFKRNFQ